MILEDEPSSAHTVCLQSHRDPPTVTRHFDCNSFIALALFVLCLHQKNKERWWGTIFITLESMRWSVLVHFFNVYSLHQKAFGSDFSSKTAVMDKQPNYTTLEETTSHGQKYFLVLRNILVRSESRSEIMEHNERDETHLQRR